MKVIVLCGGKGMRLREETEFRPKPMVLIGRKPLLWHIMKIYAHYGFNEFILALGYKSEYIKQYFLDQEAYSADFTLDTKTCEKKVYLDSRSEVDDFKITFVDTGLDTLPGERILRCQKYIPKLDNEFMVTYGDGLVDMNLRNLLKHHKEHKTIGTITGIHPRSKYGVVLTDKDNMVSEFTEKPVSKSWINGGFMVFNKGAFEYFRKGESEHPGLQRMAQDGELSLYRHEGFWACMDTGKELEDLNVMWQGEMPPWKIWT